jgi:Zn-finger nucleic acid-binding protein
MSAVERGLGGVWSCIYCEGVWLPAEQIASLLSSGAIASPLAANTTAPATERTTDPTLVCPSCNEAAFHLLSAPPLEASLCASCASVFLRKGVLAAIAPSAASSELEAEVPETILAAIASILILDPGPLIVALQSRKARTNAL